MSAEGPLNDPALFEDAVRDVTKKDCGSSPGAGVADPSRRTGTPRAIDP